MQILVLFVAAYQLSANDIALIAFFNLYLGVCLVFSSFGFKTTSVKYIGKYIGEKDSRRASAVAYLTVLISITITIFLFFIFYLFNTEFQLFIFPRDPLLPYNSPYSLFPFVLLITLPIAALNAILIGVQKVREMAIINIAGISLKGIICVVLLWSGFGVISIIYAWLISNVVILAGLSTFFFKIFPKPNFQQIPLRELFSFAFPIFLVSGLSSLVFFIEDFILTFFISAAMFGICYIFLRIFSVFQKFLESFRGYIFSYYSTIHAKYGKKNLEEKIFIISKYLAIVFIPFALLMILATPVFIELINFFFGILITEVNWYIFWALLCSVIFFSFALSYGQTLLIVYKKSVVVLKIELLIATEFLISCLILIPLLDIIGLSLATLFNAIFMLWLKYIYVNKKITIKLDFLSIKRIFFAAIPMIIVIFPVFLFRDFYITIFLIIGSLFLYLVFLKYFKCLNDDDIQLVGEIFGKRVELVIRKILFF